MKNIEHIKFMMNINNQIDNLRKNPRNESYSRLVYIAKQLISHKKQTGINIF